MNVPARKAQVVDTTGAGDTLNGAFSVQIAEGKAIEDALAYANVAAKSVYRKIWSTDRNADSRRSRDSTENPEW